MSRKKLKHCNAVHSLGAIAILVRTGAQTREFEERFLTFGIKYRVIGGQDFMKDWKFVMP